MEQGLNQGLRANFVIGVFRVYLEAKRAWLKDSERSLIRGWPDRKSNLRDAMKLQDLYCDREELRRPYLASTLGMAWSGWNLIRNLETILSRIHKIGRTTKKDVLGQVI